MHIHLRLKVGFLALMFVAGCASHREPPPSVEIDEGLYRGALRTLAGAPLPAAPLEDA